MTTEQIFSPHDPQASQIDLAGGKGFHLSWLVRNGFRVPPFIILGSSLFDELLRSNHCQNQFDEMLEKINESQSDSAMLSDIRRLIEGLQWSVDSEHLLLAKLSLIGFEDGAPYAVRSSISDEDSAEASFAGQMDSFLFQKSLSAIKQSYLKTMASMFSDHAIAYRKQHQRPIHTIKGAAIVQTMIDSERSGVMFTAHPITGSRRTLLITSVFGQGEGLVSGICNADEFSIDQDGTERERKIANKDIMLVAAPDMGTQEQAVHTELQDLPSLSREQIQELRELGLSISGLKRSPQDIEFAIADSKVFILQTRPITHLPPPQKPLGHEIVWDNSNIQESYCGVTTPLTFSHANRAYKSVYTQTLRILGTPESVIQEKDKGLSNMLGLIHGRVYYNINHWYEGLSLLPSFKTNKADMEKMMGLQDPVDFVEDAELSLWEKIKKLPQMILLLMSFLRNFARIDHLVADFLSHFHEQYKSIDRPNLHRLEVSELFKLVQQLTKNLLEQWHTPIINDFFVMMTNGKVHRHLKKAGFDNPDLIQNNLMSGEPDVESTEPTKFLIRLAEKIRQGSARDLFETWDDPDLWEVFRSREPELFKECEIYIELYGDRCMGELKLESISLRQDPSFMFAILRNFIAKPELSLEAIEAKELKMRQEAEQEAFHRIRHKRGSRALRKFKKDLQNLRKAVKYRENMRFSRTRSFGLFRDLYNEIGQQLAFYGLLEDGRDVFYLTVDELDAYHEGRSVHTELKSLVAARKPEWQQYEAKDLPHHFKTWGPVYHHNDYRYESEHSAAQEQSGDCLKGIGCYPGIVQNKVRKIFSPQDELNLDGQILCTVRTDPGWTPLFPSASGILVERGSTLSHSAVIARELGIPAIVGIPQLTEKLADGQEIKMDGAQGLIHMEVEP
ncbi:phosphoenolpyruvate synthase [Pseudobacteriovorax antillogorgiicola]|uniref:Pyruvate, water dikinase n=1 Tax=Pseudobacteriovorax antillogorgiicola TaxID=1513793 RepID=A0A1Y6CM46_9BACT|nr:phosphoenolpyruvate synthase [Pseudobacteriovorax antillogorgiicola]TCS45419.1 pyruvate,water dikinase [Pseudobacteriovorax antillogorgiicola]SMF74105.1 pyruvate, water dikinase [Pseudobacteriovorax antillogorgiicola]